MNKKEICKIYFSDYLIYVKRGKIHHKKFSNMVRVVYHKKKDRNNIRDKIIKSIDFIEFTKHMEVKRRR